MPSSYNDNDPGPDIGDVVAQVSDAAQNMFKRFGPFLFLGILVLIGLAGLYKVDPGSVGVVLRFGAENRRTGPGLHYAIPLMETKEVVNVEEVRRTEIGFRGKETLPEALMVTGDENIVEVRMIVQWRVADAGMYLFRIADPDITLRGAAEVALRTVVGQTNIDDVMTKGRARVQSATRELLQRLMADYESGIEVTEVKLDNVDAPNEVKDAFNAVTRAREEKEKLVNQAQGYEEDKVPRARGEAEKMLREAEAYKSQRVLRAKGDAENFRSVRAEYEKAKQVTRSRLHLETLQRILQNVPHKVVIDEDANRNLLPVLSLGAQAKAAAVATGAAQ